ncbi:MULTISPECIES: RagB/SusD family nutrient uptake outer membrane protein [unclassified Arenibacter]|uniref:RagB/SusD family nutrient uptake outer membrane protein n=1 Tax=unclassified Arenibacter TaxID=2615047 RepID=UPI000E34C4FD|nr:MULTISPECIES: RagB/SusD family nutrient uptake outer membrane protein [unclassified Arenibacter]MCM4162134.1 RagB/SusD family nutrient uptake outer membrane protein [Arenibacter sp. A80]RFT57750.1 RagB/SusD family nutrient uptake outer membrane protein [Arenibacter sp. P308M17]
MNIKKSFIALGTVLMLGFITACNDDFTNITPLSEVSGASVWSDPGLAEAAVSGIYLGLGPGGLDEQMLASLSDEAIFTHTGRGINTVNESRSNSDETGWIHANWDWNNMYAHLRDANLAIANLGNGGLDDAELVDRLLGEAHFMRAYYYQQLLRFYGGVPLIDEPLELDSDYNIPRNTYSECVEFIIADCERAFELLNGKSMASGRANATAALALKARVLLYAASDFHDFPTASANSSLLSTYTNPELIAYTEGSQEQRWIRARDAVKAALDYSSAGYKLGLTSPVPFDEGEQNYLNMSLARNGGESDIIWERQYVAQEGPGRRIGLFNGPNGYQNWAGNTPLQNLVDDYAMMDGSKFDWDNPTHASSPYENREPRFYATILYDGADWKPRPAASADRDPANQIQTGQYEVNGSGSVTTHFGLDTRQSPIEDWNGTRSGYYFKKFTEPDPAFVDQTDFQTIPWPFFRQTELVLNYVETLLETDEEAEALTWLNQIRYRVGLPAIVASGEDLVEAYRNERRLELAYEEHRYHDVRRWMIAPTTSGAPAVGIQITGALKPGANVSLYKYDPSNYDYSYVPTVVDPGFENRLWLDKSYFVPIRIAEINANTALIQNPGYD